MAVGPIVNWWGGAGGAPPVVPPLDKFAPKYLVGNQLAGDGLSPSLAGFNYILDPGDGSGVALALSQPSGSGDVYVRPGTYTGAGTLLIPPGVAVRGAWKELTKFSGFNFVLDTDSSLQDVGIEVTTGIAVASVVGATGLKLEDLNIESSGSLCLLLDGAGPNPRQSTVERAFCRKVGVNGSVVVVRNGAIVSAQSVQITGGDNSIRIENDGNLFGSKIFTDSAAVSVTFSVNTGIGVVHFHDSIFISNGGNTIETDAGVVDGARFLNCVFRELSGRGCLALSGTVTDMLFDGCEFIGDDVNAVGNFDRLVFDNCKITTNSANESFLITGPNGYISFGNCTIENANGPVFTSASPLNIENSVIVANGGLAAVTLNGDGGKLNSTSFSTSNGSPCLNVTSSENVFSANRYNSSITYTATADGNVDSASVVDNSSNAGPAIVVLGSENTFTSIRTKTQALTPGIEFRATAQNNIVLALNAKGPGSGVLAVLDNGFANEVAHIIGT